MNGLGWVRGGSLCTAWPQLREAPCAMHLRTDHQPGSSTYPSVPCPRMTQSCPSSLSSTQWPLQLQSACHRSEAEKCQGVTSHGSPPPPPSFLLPPPHWCSAVWRCRTFSLAPWNGLPQRSPQQGHQPGPWAGLLLPPISRPPARSTLHDTPAHTLFSFLSQALTSSHKLHHRLDDVRGLAASATSA